MPQQAPSRAFRHPTDFPGRHRSPRHGCDIPFARGRSRGALRTSNVKKLVGRRLRLKFLPAPADPTRCSTFAAGCAARDGVSGSRPDVPGLTGSPRRECGRRPGSPREAPSRSFAPCVCRHPARGVPGQRMAFTTRGRVRLDGSAVRKTAAEVGPDRPNPTGGPTCAHGPPFWSSYPTTRSTPCPCQ
jgi:hypothetical protein